jgi:kynureninase
MEALHRKSRLLTGYLEWLLHETFQHLSSTDGQPLFEIMTPSNPMERGCQLSLLFREQIKPIFVKLMDFGVVCDKREPNCIRVAPVPLYNSFEDVWQFVQFLAKALEQ